MRTTILATALLLAPTLLAQTAQVPPKMWVDKDTGHRVIRLTDEPSSSGFYFNVNAYTPDLKQMIYTAPDGIHAMDLATRKTRLIVPNPPRPTGAANDSQFRSGGVHAIIAGRVTQSVFYTMADPATHNTAIYRVSVVFAPMIFATI